MGHRGTNRGDVALYFHTAQTLFGSEASFLHTAEFLAFWTLPAQDRQPANSRLCEKTETRGSDHRWTGSPLALLAHVEPL